jgi:homeobox protein cut-like
VLFAELNEVPNPCCCAGNQVSELEGKLEDKEALVKQLEEDLLETRGAAKAAAGAQRAALLSLDGAGSLDAPTPRGGGGASFSGVGSGADEESVVRVLVGQRERLRARVKELEEQLSAARGAAEAARRQLEAARADNVALVERLRYVGGYRQQAAARKVRAHGARRNYHMGCAQRD